VCYRFLYPNYTDERDIQNYIETKIYPNGNIFWKSWFFGRRANARDYVNKRRLTERINNAEM